MNTEDLLTSVTQELGINRLARKRYAAKLSPDFNCFNYIEPDELRLSCIISELLDPNGNHSQGNLFLSSFLRHLELASWNDLNSVRVNTEVVIKDNRRFDIELRNTDNALVIENKPRAMDQENQLHDYINDLKNQNVDNWHLVYLCGTNERPSANSISEEELEDWENSGHVLVRTYVNLIVPWLDECISICMSDRVRWFLGEFKAYVLAEFKGERDMEERQAVINQVLKSSDTIDAAFEISSAMIDIKQKLLLELKDQLQKRGDRKKWPLDWVMNIEERYQRISFSFFQSEEEQSYFPCFQFHKTQLNFLMYGIVKGEEGYSENQEIFDLMETGKFGFGRGKKTAWWPWVTSVNNEIRNWEWNSNPWGRISNGTLADEIFRTFELTHNLFLSNNRIHLLKR